MVAVSGAPGNRAANSDPAPYGEAVTPSDSTELPFLTRGLYVGGAGNVYVEMLNSLGAYATVAFIGVTAGSLLPIVCRKVRSTSTTATNIVALW